MKERTLVRFVLLMSGFVACSEVVDVLTPPVSGGTAGADAGLDAAPDASVDAGGSSGSAAQDAGPDGDSGAELDAAPRDAGIVGTTLDSGDAHTCATVDGRLYCWGAGSRGRLGLGDTMDRTRPVQVGIDADWVEVTAAAQHSCVLNAGGDVYCFGANDQGQLGVSNVTESLEPLPIPLPAPATFVVAEQNATCALLADERLYCWGENIEGQLGLGDTYPGDNHFEPIEVASTAEAGATANYLAVDTGQGHVCAVRSPGELYCWGRNTGNQLGLGGGVEIQFREPTRVGTLSNWESVQAGQESSCAINSAHELYCWGSNSFAELGTGDRDDRDLPALIAAGSSFNAVSIDTFHGCAIDVLGELYCWGRGVEGQLGTGDVLDRESPERVSTEHWKQVAVGRFFTCAVRDDDVIHCTGDNGAGALGQGDTERRKSLAPVTL